MPCRKGSADDANLDGVHGITVVQIDNRIGEAIPVSGVKGHRSAIHEAHGYANLMAVFPAKLRNDVNRGLLVRCDIPVPAAFFDHDLGADCDSHVF
jgi:hypothetical protein